MTKATEDCKTLIFKNIPKEIEDLTNLLESLKIPAQQIKPFGRKRALITYQCENDAEKALETLNELEFNGKAVNIALFLPNKPKENIETKPKTNTKKCNKKVQTNGLKEEESLLFNTLAQQQINKYVQKLYAIEGDLGFDQPPPPYLKYNYPPINKLILDNISTTLLSNKRFYIQVLHLMNRMNLEPPFAKRTYKFTCPGIPKETSTQTEESIIKENLTSYATHEVEDNESELESSEEDTIKQKPQPNQIKRKLPPQQDEQYKKRARQMLQTVQKQSKEIETKKLSTTTTNLSIKDIFDTKEQSTSSLAAAVQHKIELNLKRSANTKAKDLKKPLDLQQSTKLSLNELAQLSIFKNYQKGLPSNKLYIKNLHKDITTEDLQLIYGKYLKDTNISLDIKVMQHGRMKGQAFVTFQTENLDIIQPLIEHALEDTNGFVLHDKPMVVCYGKQS